MPFTEKPALMEGAVGLVSTAEDFVRFSQMLLNKGELGGVRLLKAETVASMTVNALSPSILKEKGGNVGWGLAQRRRRRRRRIARLPDGDRRIRVGRIGGDLLCR